MGRGMAGTCSYTHDLEGDTWECPHDADREYCLFHRPVADKSDEAVASALRERANRAGDESKEFVGARFGDLDLAFARLDAPDNYPVSLVDATVEGEFRLTSGAVEQPLVLDGMTVEGEAACENVAFGAECAAAGARFERGVDFQGSAFAERLRMSGARFGGPANFHAVEFGESVDFGRTDFAAAAEFALCRFGGDVDFDDARFAGQADFESVRVRGKADFRGVRFGAAAEFRDAAFERSVAFGDRSGTDAEVDHRASTTESVFEFEGALEHVDRRTGVTPEDRAVDGDRPHFGGRAGFVDAEFVEEVTFQGVRFAGRPVLRDATFRDPLVVVAPAVEDGVIDLRDSEIPDGTLGQPAGGGVVYDLQGATLGEVTVESGEGSAFEQCRLLHTTFDGFDFGQYRDALAASDWRIHTTGGALDSSPSLGDLEATYLKAKNGADAVGDNKAAAEFFRRQLLYRRRLHGSRVLDGEGVRERAVAAGRWVANGLLDLSSGYGERPSRVVVFSLLAILGFAPLYWLIHPEPIYPSVGPFGYVVFSFESFATVIHAGGPPIPGWDVRFLAEVEAFTGAFLIALFVFTLTRSINR